MSEEKKTEELLKEAVEEAMNLPVPETKKEERKPYLFETVSFNKGLKKNKFRTGSKFNGYDFKLDENGNKIPHGNGFVMVKK